MARLCSIDDCECAHRAKGLCQRHYSINWRKDHPEQVRDAKQRKHTSRREWIDKIKTDAGCIDCGYNADPVALQFDHVRGEKVNSISMMAYAHQVTNDVLLSEIDKCQVRCANCHAIATRNRTQEK